MDGLPELVLLQDHGGNAAAYLDAVYRIYRRDFITSQPVLHGRPCFSDNRRADDGREIGFWHIVTEGRVEDERLPNMRRCERIAWPRAIIEAAATPVVKSWYNERKRQSTGKRDRRLLLAVTDFSYLVVLAETARAYRLVTAYYIEHENQRRKLEKEYAENS